MRLHPWRDREACGSASSEEKAQRTRHAEVADIVHAQRATIDVEGPQELELIFRRLLDHHGLPHRLSIGVEIFYFKTEAVSHETVLPGLYASMPNCESPNYESGQCFQ